MEYSEQIAQLETDIQGLRDVQLQLSEEITSLEVQTKNPEISAEELEQMNAVLRAKQNTLEEALVKEGRAQNLLADLRWQEAKAANFIY